MAKEFCSRGIVMQKGVKTFDGNIDEAIEKYKKTVKK
jgi:ABC-type polysaccharide/polyol phosphate transport system ATPase subunit